MSLSEFNVETEYGRHALKLTYQKISNPELIISGLDLKAVIKDSQKHIEMDQGCPGSKWLGLNFEGDLAEESILPVLAKALKQASLPGKGLEPLQNVRRFLNRILGLPFAQQTMLFNLFSHMYNQVVISAKAAGRFDMGALKVRGRSLVRNKVSLCSSGFALRAFSIDGAGN